MNIQTVPVQLRGAVAMLKQTRDEDPASLKPLKFPASSNFVSFKLCSASQTLQSPHNDKINDLFSYQIDLNAFQVGIVYTWYF